MKRKLTTEILEKRQLLAADPCIFPGQADVVETVNNFANVFSVDNTLRIRGDNTDNSVVLTKVGPNSVLSDTTQTNTISTSFENFNGDRSDIVNFALESGDLMAQITGRAGTRGVKPAYNNGAFALGIGENVSIVFSKPVDVKFAIREIVELTPDVVGVVTLTGTLGSKTIEANSNGANPPQSGDWDVVDSTLLGIGQVTRVDMVTSNGITNLDDLSFTASQSKTQRFNGVRNIDALMAGGNDTVINNTNIRSVMNGGLGNDTLVGGSLSDRLNGSFGDDVLIGGAGNDIMQGGVGNDSIFGGEGNDFLFGNNGNDLIFGGNGNDRIFGGNGDDILFGEQGSDIVDGGYGNDFLSGGDGNDVVNGSFGTDVVFGGLGKDILYLGQNEISDGDDDDRVFVVRFF